MEAAHSHESFLRVRCFHHKHNENNSESPAKPHNRPMQLSAWEVYLLGPHRSLQGISLWQKGTPQVSPCCLFMPVAHILYATHRITTWQSGRATGGHQPNLLLSRRNPEAESLINSPQGAGGGSGLGTLSPALQPAPPAKEILQKLFQPFENRHQY